MKYRIRVFNKNTNKEEMRINEVFESEEAAEAAIERLKASISKDNQYIKIPVK
jgi:outer membrane protein assembly factor BamD (BamD/ComL family)